MLSAVFLLMRELNRNPHLERMTIRGSCFFLNRFFQLFESASDKMGCGIFHLVDLRCLINQANQILEAPAGL